MKLVFLIGDAAVGKMTVGQELMKLTGLRLFHNHMTIEPVIEIFGYYDGQTVARLREVVFEEFAKSDSKGMIFTYMWAFDQPSDWAYVRHVTDLFRAHEAEIYYVELVAPQEVRLFRNETENRLKHKASKQDLARSRRRILEDDQKYRCVSREGEIPFANYLRIDNSALTAEEAARQICEQFGL
ncbi:MAG: AAA family ATPase [Clostridiaceae bacterium]|nr:AAA family ATPase [Clostridiaceae bacterium]